jgi:hypothetical protein
MQWCDGALVPCIHGSIFKRSEGFFVIGRSCWGLFDDARTFVACSTHEATLLRSNLWSAYHISLVLIVEKRHFKTTRARLHSHIAVVSCTKNRVLSLDGVFRSCVMHGRHCLSDNPYARWRTNVSQSNIIINLYAHAYIQCQIFVHKAEEFAYMPSSKKQRAKQRKLNWSPKEIHHLINFPRGAL